MLVTTKWNLLYVHSEVLPVTVIDCRYHIEGSIIKILEYASVILVVTNPEILVVNQTKKNMGQITNAFVSTRCCQNCLNKMTPNNPYNSDFLAQALKRQVVTTIAEDNELARTGLTRSR